MMLLAFIAPATARNVLLVLVGGCYLGYHLYHLWQWWRVRELKVEVEKRDGVRVGGQLKNLPADAEGAVGRRVPSPPQSEINMTCVGESNAGRSAIGPYHPTVQQEELIHCSPSPSTSTASPIPPTSLSGEELYAKARAMPHQPIPDYEMDGEYLKLLAQSAAKDYPMALAKLGDYAMRRGCDVEAYYWLWRARKAGVGGLDRTLLQVRSVWASGGFCREIENEHEFFTYEQGTIGYALLCIDSRHNTNAAKACLAECECWEEIMNDF